MVRLDVEQRRSARLGEEHAQAEPGQVGGAAPLDGGKGRRVCGEQRGDTGHRRPHQHLVARNHAEGTGHSTANAALASGGDQRQISRAWNAQENDDRGGERAVVGNAKHGEAPTSKREEPRV
ncbi:hypothetical protein SDC9_161493 [bioreactor metagenome]|uniref:Uncharacterized protein n=1 Tax=bioreactor metagenome TaxID=1076179 RepID=A0A645FIH8_9ZZZZ